MKTRSRKLYDIAKNNIQADETLLKCYLNYLEYGCNYKQFDLHTLHKKALEILDEPWWYDILS